ncbi:MAG: c-type cytochrome [Fluviicola sp.]|nr:c-type cytochrome [Fluviicola sp.]
MKFKGQIILFIFSFFAFAGNAQDGESLFKVNCAACHLLGKDGTGPNLKGVQQKWADAEESELLYEWVENSMGLIASGKSTMALKADEYSPMPMPPTMVSREEIDAILSFVNDFAPAPPPEEKTDVKSTDTSEKVIKYVPNYKKNLKLFYWLIAALLIQIIALFSVTGALKSMIKLDKIKKTGLNTVLAIIGMFGFIGATNTSSALSFMEPGQAEGSAPWLLVENSDLVVLVVLNVILLLIFLHVRKLFMEVVKTIRPQTEEQKKKTLTKRQKRKMNSVLMDIVPIEDEKSILLEHEYDGIKELDNNLPPWWVWMFWATIIFGVIYIFNYHILGTGDLQIAEYDKEMIVEQEKVDTYLAEQGMQIDESNVTLMEDESDLVTGKSLFEVNCISCHGPNGGGTIGPNLTDNTWIYGYNIVDVFTTVKNGTKNAMPEHASKLNPIELQQVASFVLSMPEATGKSPEGDIIEE